MELHRREIVKARVKMRPNVRRVARLVGGSCLHRHGQCAVAHPATLGATGGCGSVAVGGAGRQEDDHVIVGNCRADHGDRKMLIETALPGWYAFCAWPSHQRLDQLTLRPPVGPVTGQRRIAPTIQDIAIQTAADIDRIP